jgi:hypothetical protein
MGDNSGINESFKYLSHQSTQDRQLGKMATVPTAAAGRGGRRRLSAKAAMFFRCLYKDLLVIAIYSFALWA